MATVYKNLNPEDISSVRTMLHEAIPITGSIISGTYTSDSNIKTYGHAMFQSVYDYPYLSSSANHIFDVTFGASTLDSNYSLITSQQQKKNNIYNQMAQLLVGYDETGSIRPFDRDGNFSGSVTSTANLLSPIFINFSRLLSKDEIQKETFSIEFMVSSGFATPANSTQRIKLFDSGALNNYRINSPTGEYGILYVTGTAGSAISGAAVSASSGTNPTKVGLIFYQAGVAVLDSAVFLNVGSGGILSSSCQFNSAGNTLLDLLTGSTIDTMANGLRNRIYNISFNNTTELNSTIYHCMISPNEFNYSSNPTYLSQSQVRVKNIATDTPVAYFTTVGLYSADNELLAVAKLSEPLRKDPTVAPVIRVRLDY